MSIRQTSNSTELETVITAVVEHILIQQKYSICGHIVNWHLPSFVCLTLTINSTVFHQRGQKCNYFDTSSSLA